MIWQPILGYEGYEVSDAGLIRSTKKRGRTADPEGLLRGVPNPVTGYLMVNLHRPGGQKTYHVHELVCAAFHGVKPSADSEVRHLNGDRQDNRAENLAWGTSKENSEDAYRHGTLGRDADGRFYRP